MKKTLLLLLVAMACMFASCPRKEGEEIIVTCQAVDLTDSPLAKRKISLVSSDSFILLNPVVVQQAETDSKGNVSFTFNYNSKKYFFVTGDSAANLNPIQTYGITRFRVKNSTDFKIQFDNITTIKINITSNKPKLKRGELFVRHSELQDDNSGIIRRDVFPIGSTTLDTTISVNMFSHAEFDINTSLFAQDTSYWLRKGINRNGKRDTVFIFKF